MLITVSERVPDDHTVCPATARPCPLWAPIAVIDERVRELDLPAARRPVAGGEGKLDESG